MGDEEPRSGTAHFPAHPWVSALAFFVVYVGISIGIHWLTGNGFPSGFITEHLVGGAVATAVYTVLTMWLFRRRSGHRNR